MIYFKGTRGIFEINMREQEISLLLKRTLTKKLLENNRIWKSEIVREQVTPLRSPKMYAQRIGVEGFLEKPLLFFSCHH